MSPGHKGKRGHGVVNSLMGEDPQRNVCVCLYVLSLNVNMCTNATFQ